VASSRIDRLLVKVEEEFRTPLSEIEAGKKTGHWMWWIFPQAKGLGTSEKAKKYAIESLDEAVACLADPVFGDRYCQMVDAVWAQVVKGGTRVRIMFPDPDDRKLVSSLTLFRRAAEHLTQLQRPEPDRRAFSLLIDQSTEILERAQGEGLGSCSLSQGLE
jgi:uncharacterized protein (DUF1810 family)